RRHRVVARGLELQEMNGDGVAGLGALDVEGTGLWIVVSGGHHLRRQIAGGLHEAVEAVLGPRHDARAGHHPRLRRRAAERVHEIAMTGDPAQGWRRGWHVAEERRARRWPATWSWCCCRCRWRGGLRVSRRGVRAVATGAARGHESGEAERK